MIKVRYQQVRLSTSAGGLATLGLIGAAIGVGISSGGALIAIPLVFCVCVVTFLAFVFLYLLVCLPLGLALLSGLGAALIVLPLAPAISH